MTSLKGVDEPMLMRLRRHATVVVKTTEMRNRNPSIIELVYYVYAVNRLAVRLSANTSNRADHDLGQKPRSSWMRPEQIQSSHIFARQ